MKVAVTSVECDANFAVHKSEEELCLTCVTMHRKTSLLTVTELFMPQVTAVYNHTVKLKFPVTAYQSTCTDQSICEKHPQVNFNLQHLYDTLYPDC